MAYIVYPVSPLKHMMATDSPRLFTDAGFSPWVMNGKIDKNSFMKRWGYLKDCDMGKNNPVLGLAVFQQSTGDSYSMILTDKDVCIREAAGTFSYITPGKSYAAAVASIATDTVTFKAATIADTEDIAVGDMFILVADATANSEPNDDWAEIKTVNKAGGFYTSIVLTANYTGTTGTWTGSEKEGKIRNLYATPKDERWQFATVNDKFCFTNGDMPVQVWDGTGVATDLDPVNARRAKYCISYANRLFIANDYVDASPNPLAAPYTVQWSKENDCTDWTDTSAGQMDLLDTEDFITGLAVVGPNLVIFKRESYSIWYRTGVATNPILRSSWQLGVGTPAPYSIAQYMGTAAWVGRDDFYAMNGDQAVAIGEKIRHTFFDIVPDAELKKVWAGTNYIAYEIMWVANTDYGQLGFVWNWKHNEWYIYKFASEMTCFGKGLIV